MSPPDQEALIHQNVGKCLAEWSRVEFGVALLFTALNGRKLRANDPLLASFEANRSFEAKRQALVTFVKSDDSLSGNFRERFARLDRRLSKLARKRAEVAHFQVRMHHDASHPEGIARLHPFGSFTGSFFEREPQPLNVQDLADRAKQFSELAERVFRFVTYLKNVRGLLERGDKRDPAPELLLEHPFAGVAPDVVVISWAALG